VKITKNDFGKYLQETPKQVKGKAVQLQASTGPEDSRRSRLPDFRGFQEVEATRFLDNRHMKVVVLSTGRV
jgi:hypothetical protein